MGFFGKSPFLEKRMATREATIMATRAATMNLKDQAQAHFEKEFRRIDADNNGRISKVEFAEQLDRAGWASSKRKNWIDKVYVKFAAQPDDGMDLSEFMAFTQQHREDVVKAFRAHDIERRGRISQQDLRKALNMLQIPYLDSGLDRLLRLRHDNEASINFEQFQEIVFLLPEVAQNEYILHHLFVIHEPPPETTDSMLLTAGAISAFFSRTCTAPMDRLRAIIATGGADGISDAMKVAQEGKGIRGLWVGNGVNCLQTMPEHAITFWMFEIAKHQIAKDPVKPTISEQFAAGSFAGWLAMSIVYPMYTMQQRIGAAPHGTYEGLVDCMHKTYSEDGVKSFYTGYVTGALRVVPAQGLNLAVYQTMRGYLADPQTGEISSARSMLGGAVAAGISQFVTYPLLLARTRLQTSPPGTYKGLTDCLGQAWKKGGGPKGWFPGV